MARKSRKHLNSTGDVKVQAFIRENALPTAAYIRLSVENSGQESDETLQMQMKLVHLFIQEHHELSLADTYIDNGATGTNFERKEFLRMMEDVKKGRIQCVVVKDLSRFGRDYLETGYYLDQLFPLLNVRFIAVTDRYDSADNNSRESIMVPVKNMVNAMYAKDLSRKLELAVQLRFNSGKVSKVNAPYGYTFSKANNCLEKDPNVAPYLYMLFAWAAAGVPRPVILNRLNEIAAPCPGTYKSGTGDKWSSGYVRNLLSNPAFIGTIAMGKTKACLYKGVENHTVPKKEWIYYPDAHEPYWLEEDYKRVGEQIDENRRQRRVAMDQTQKLRDLYPDIFHGKVYCGKCGRRMSHLRKRVTYNNGVAICRYYRCNAYYRQQCNNNHFVELIGLKILIMDQIRTMIHTALDGKKTIQAALLKYDPAKKKLPIERKIGRLTEQIHDVEEKMMNAYEDYAGHLLEENDFHVIKARLSNTRDNLLEEQRNLNRRLEDMRLATDRFCSWAEKIQTNLENVYLDETQLSELVSRIIIYDQEHITVEFACHDVYDEALVNEMIEQLRGA